MSEQKHIKWLVRQLPELVRQDVLSEESAEQLRYFYRQRHSGADYNMAFVIAGILGAVLIGGGIIMIFAYNWEDLSRSWRTVLSFMPLIVAQLLYTYTFFKKPQSTVWVESSAAFLMLMLAATISLISQTYHIAGSMESFLFYWMILSIPLLYLMNASLPAIIYLMGIASWAWHADGSHSVYYYGFLAAAAPHLVYNINPKAPTARANILGWTLIITVAIAYYGVIEMKMPIYSLLGAAILLALQYVFGQHFYKYNRMLYKRPLRTFSVSMIFIMCMMLGYDWPDEVFSARQWLFGMDYARWAGFANWLFWIASLIGLVWLALRRWRLEKPINWFVFLFPLMIGVGLWLSINGQTRMAIVLANVYLFGFGIFYIQTGIRRRRIALVNIGMFFIASLIIARFFDTNWSFITKGVVFVLLGIGFLLVNVALNRRLKGGRDIHEAETL